MEKVYVGARDSDTPAVSIVEDSVPRPLPLRLDLREHSTTPEWGYGQGGPAQLALAILADVTGADEYAERHHHWFKLEVISKLPWNGWELTERQVWDWIGEHHPLNPQR